ncbi:MAG: glucosyltransferase domain-containing protein [Oscillospiraceae bacterium]|nr:glucosyltransferase domain-containing protein [Oscillospiraceae bacterium]
MNIRESFRQDRLPFFASFTFGLLACGFCMTNKIPVGDDLVGMFDKGATTVSGRYGLELLRFIMPDVSMPWIYGLMSIALLSLAVCVTVRLFSIKSPVLQLLLAGVFVTFPAQAGTMLYMFTAAPYALSLLLAVTGVWLFAERKKGCWIAAPVLIAFSCSIYQGYFSIAASFCVIRMIVLLCRTETSWREVFREGVKMLAMLLASLALYGVMLLVASKLLGFPLLHEVINDRQSFPLRVLVAYSSWVKTLLSGRFGYVNNRISQVMHLVLLLAAAFAMLMQLKKKGETGSVLLTGLCLILYPLSCYCLYLLADNSYIHSLSLYSFASLYVLCAALLDGWEAKSAPNLRRLCSLALALILCGNIYYANALYLRYYLRFEELKSFYTVMLTRVFETPGCAEGDRLAIVGDAPALVYDIDRHFTGSPLSLPSLELGSTDYAQLIISRYLGCDIPFVSDGELAQLETDDMPVYPYDGSVKKIGDVIVVKFSPKESEQ